MSGPYPIKDVVRQCLKMWGVSHRAATRQARLASIWEETVDEETARHTFVLGLRREVLQVEVDSAARLQELTCFRKGEFLAALKQALPDCHIRDIRFVHASGPARGRFEKENLG
ncbi:MAG: hypothetical protein AMS15_02770 [Planctomycetes bacterium DG_23]|nr:MAG: hypothetical protein AMS15_02770 [Planctomycetes bacterium DG_23]